MVAVLTNIGTEAGGVARTARWGPLHLVRTWLGSGAPREQDSSEWADLVVVQPAQPPAPAPVWQPTMVWQPVVAFDRRAASIALHDALSAWRAAERSLIASDATTAERARVADQVRAFRATYQRLFEELRTNSREE